MPVSVGPSPSPAGGRGARPRAKRDADLPCGQRPCGTARSRLVWFPGILTLSEVKHDICFHPVPEPNRPLYWTVDPALIAKNWALGQRSIQDPSGASVPSTLFSAVLGIYVPSTV
ncbi:hypothetical protein PCASD_12251 [Puccinia coronata f. sp. avenae]|uniref:Uncharacterized protein n=1 Tax=Puccinia coronata f. sp. avenae TaxID=200324 RepID=A0A2N5T9G3_9BASI|nr:hypothetical protein PCASD_12251 [Puccinia coronata f. sp. avenae]